MNDSKLEEKRRLEAVHQFLQMDFNKSSEYQDIVDLAAELCEKPVALLTLLDENVNWLKVRYGVSMEIMPRDTSFCQYGIQEDALLIVADATKDERFADNPLVLADPKLRFYAGAPLKLSNGLKLGTLCLFDVKPSTLTALQQKTLRILSRQITYLMELEISHKLLKLQIEETEEKNKSLYKIAQIQSHEVRHPLANIMGLVNLIKYNYQKVDSEWIRMIEEATNSLDNKIFSIVNETVAEKDIKIIRFNKMVEEIEDYAIILLDKNGNIENWNNGAKKMKGYEAIEIIGKNFATFYTDKDLESNYPQSLIERVSKNGTAKDHGWRVRKDGSEFWASVVITAIHDDKGNVIGFTKVTRDLTDKKLAEKASKEYIKQLEDKIMDLEGENR